MTRMNPTRRRRAVILLLVLWIVVILSLFAYSLLFSTSTEGSITVARKRQMQAEALARAGLARALVDLRNDMIFDTAEGADAFDGEGDVWARPEEGKLDFRMTGTPEGHRFNTRVIDEERFFNLNRFTPTNMVILQKIIERIGYSEEDAAFVAAAIVDWRDADFVPAFQDPPSQNEGLAYAMIMAEDQGARRVREEDVEPVVLRNEDFLNVNELLEVYGVTPDLFFGPGSPEAEFYREQFGDRYAFIDRFQIDQRGRRSRLDEGPPLGLRDFLTVHGSGTLNVNTAPEHVLSVLAEAAGNVDGDNFANRLVRNRRRGRSTDIDNSEAFRTMTDLSANREVAGTLTTANALYPLGIQSTVFRVVSVGEVEDTRSTIVALVSRNSVLLQRNEDFETIRRAEEFRRETTARTQRREDRNNRQLVRYPAVRITQMFIE